MLAPTATPTITPAMAPSDSPVVGCKVGSTVGLRVGDRLLTAKDKATMFASFVFSCNIVVNAVVLTAASSMLFNTAKSSLTTEIV
jgi:hypothetical protein